MNRGKIQVIVARITEELDGLSEDIDRASEDEAWVADYIAYAQHHLRGIVNGL